MNPSGLTYANDLCAAFVTAIVASFYKQYPDGFLGRIALQKLTYFVQVLGVPVPCSFGIYTYGPYSDTITFTVESLLADEVIMDESVNPKYSKYAPSKNAENLIALFRSELTPHYDKIDRTVRALGGFPPRDLELVATLHFVAAKQKQVLKGDSSKESVIREFKSIKKNKFSDEDIQAWYEGLVEAQLV